MALHIQTSLLRTTCSIHQRVGSALSQFYVYALAILHVYSRTAVGSRLVGQRQSVELQRSLIGTAGVESTVLAASAQVIGYLRGKVVSLCHAHMRSRHLYGHPLSYVASHGHLSRCAVIRHVYGIVSHRAVVHRHTAYLAQVKLLVEYRQRRAITVCHLTSLSRWKLIGHIAHLHIQRLCPSCYRQYQGSKYCI